MRLVVDIENAGLSTNLPTLESNEHISLLRSGSPKDKVLRFVFELKKSLKYTDFVLSPNELYGHRLVVDLVESGSSVSDDFFRQLLEESESGIAQKKEMPIADSEKFVVINSGIMSINEAENKPVIIAINAGHGGEDPGAIGRRGSQEKKVTLEIARKLKAIVDNDPRMRSIMIRQGDYYIKLDKRREMARAAKADIYISIHADAFRKQSARGLSVFALSQRGATSAMARALAKKENASDLIGGVSLADKDEVLAKVLVDLSMTNTISESVHFGGRVLKELGKLGKLHSKRVEQAGFLELKSADTPSILIETGFITNLEEERKLISNSYQQKIANAIYTAINEYYQQTPYRSNANYATPSIDNQNSFTSLVKPKSQRPSYHKVVRGDSLSKIALRYGTTSKAIKQLNKLRSNTVVLGKRLKLPSNSKNISRVSSRPAYHTVRNGESLSKISVRYNVTMSALKANNNLRKDSIYIGQKLKIPGGVVTKQATKPSNHKVKRGDSLSEIAERYGVSMSKIMQANSLRSKTVKLGQTLKIPN